MKKIITFLLAITICGCDIKDNYYTKIYTCVVDTTYIKQPSNIGEFQPIFVYKTSCGFNISSYNSNLYKKKDTIHIKKLNKKLE